MIYIIIISSVLVEFDRDLTVWPCLGSWESAESLRGSGPPWAATKWWPSIRTLKAVMHHHSQVHGEGTVRWYLDTYSIICILYMFCIIYKMYCIYIYDYIYTLYIYIIIHIFFFASAFWDFRRGVYHEFKKVAAVSPQSPFRIRPWKRSQSLLCKRRGTVDQGLPVHWMGPHWSHTNIVQL